MGLFENISPLDHRYRASDEALWKELAQFLSEEGYLRYQLAVEAALVQALANWELCSQRIADEVAKAAKEVTCAEVQVEEAITKHNVRALVNCLRERVSEEARPFVHLTATSVDILDTARALQLKAACTQVLLPYLTRLLRIWIELASQEAETPQIGRTHGQHGVPITFGFAVAEYVSRLGGRIDGIAQAAGSLKGKMAGAVGAYNASSLFFERPQEFEREVLSLLDLEPGMHATQIVEPEYMADLMHQITSTFGILANFADDVRHLQRTEIGEVGEQFDANQVGSSTMPHKRNPWNYENIKSMWKAFAPRMVTVYMDQISEHQRDLTNSASSRFLTEMAAGLTMAAGRMIRVTSKLSVDRARMQENLTRYGQAISAEPLYVILASLGHPNAHEYVRRLTLKVDEQQRSLAQLAQEDPELEPYFARMTAKQRRFIEQPVLYRGQAVEKTHAICQHFRQKLEKEWPFCQKEQS